MAPKRPASLDLEEPPATRPSLDIPTRILPQTATSYQSSPQISQTGGQPSNTGHVPEQGSDPHSFSPAPPRSIAEALVGTDSPESSAHRASWIATLMARTFPDLHSEGDDDEDIVDAVRRRIRTALSIKPNPFSESALKKALEHTRSIEIQQHVDEILPILKNGDWFGAVSTFIDKCTAGSELSLGQSDFELRDSTTKLYTHWQGEYCGGSLQALKETLMEHERTFGSRDTTYYSKTLNILQSSGMGKSRLADEMGKEYFEFPFVFRRQGDTGYPPGDSETAAFLSEGKTPIPVRVAAFLGAVGKIGFEWYSGEVNRPSGGMSSASIAKTWHHLMAPVPWDQINKDEERAFSPESFARFAGRLQTRSRFRRERYRALCKEAATLSNYIFRRFNNGIDEELIAYDPELRERVVKPIEDLLNMIKANTRQDAPEPLLLLVIDEAANLDQDVLVSLRRMMRLFLRQSMWCIFLSTNNSIETLMPSRKQESSSRIQDRTLVRLSPFLGFPVDLEARRRMKDPSTRLQELSRSLVEISHCDHLTTFGRPLWRVYSGSSYNKLQRFALAKLLGGSTAFDSSNPQHVFAIVSSRVCLDPCLNVESSFLSTAVDSHLRLVIAMDERDGRLRTINPSEPIVADAAASTLMKRTEDLGWTDCIYTLSRHLLGGGLVEKGTKGELYARLVCILGRDFLLREKIPLAGPVSYSTMCQWSQPFPVMDFLKYLVGTTDWDSIACYQPQQSQPRGEKAKQPLPRFRDAFASAMMNFTHFCSTSKALSPEHTPELLHDLLRQCAGLQLSFGQKGWDIMIPTYFGPADQPFDPDLVSALVIQVKNKDRRNKLDISSAALQWFKKLAPTQPLLAILLDLGIASQPAPVPIYQAQVGMPACWGIYLQGADSTTFNFMKMDPELEKACRGLLMQVSPVMSAQYHICQSNMRFNKHSRAARWA